MWPFFSFWNTNVTFSSFWFSIFTSLCGCSRPSKDKNDFNPSEITQFFKTPYFLTQPWVFFKPLFEKLMRKHYYFAETWSLHSLITVSERRGGNILRTLRLENGVQKFSAVLLEVTCALEICEQPFRLQNPTSHTPWQPDNFLNFNRDV